MLAPPTPAALSQRELIELSAVDNEFFCKTFFPRAFRGESPRFDPQLWAAIENPNFRLLNLKVFRGGTKTTKLRAFTAKRLAFGLSKTILYIGASEGHATRSVQWLRGAIEPRMAGDGTLRSTLFAQTFGLKPGKKWQEHEFEVVQSLPQADGSSLETTSWVLGVGITGNIRGINFDDYRPDLIILDDVITDENAATQPQRDKLADLIMGAVKNSLASPVEFPNSKMIMLQTPLDREDASARASRSLEWHTETFGCWTEETEDLPVELQESIWPALFPSEELRKQKLAATADNRYSVFAREWECKLTTVETASFRPDWLRKYETAPKVGACVISIDPVPPPSDRQTSKNLKGKDFEAISVVARSAGEYYLLDYALSRGHEPDWTANKLFEYLLRYRPQCCILSLVSAERYLKWYLEKEMARRRKFVPLKEAVIGTRSKFARITAALAGVASAGHLWCGKHHSEFILQYESYGVGYRGMDDLLESVANGVAELTNPYLELGSEEYEEVEEFPFAKACP